MRSPAQIRASRANGARSRGPVTEEGKRRSSYNAIRHGLLANCVVLCNESRSGFEALLQQHVDRFQPADDVEFGFIEEMAGAYWRLRRAWAIETKMFDQRIAKMPSGDQMASIASSLDDLAGAQTLALLNRYETRLHCMYQRALRNLLLLRSQDAAVSDPHSAGELQEELEADAPLNASSEIPNEPNKAPAGEISAFSDQPSVEGQPPLEQPASDEIPNEPAQPSAEELSALPGEAPADRLFAVIVEMPNEPKPAPTAPKAPPYKPLAVPRATIARETGAPPAAHLPGPLF